MRSFLILAMLLFAAGSTARAQDAPVTYRVSWPEPRTHYFHVDMEIDEPRGDVVDVRIPAWRPGRYILQNYAKDIVGFEAMDESGTALPFRKTDKGTWRIQSGDAERVVVRYLSYANQLDAGASYLGPEEAYLNPITALMYVPGRELEPAALVLEKPADWRVATALDYDEAAGAYVSPTYHDLVDSPVIVSPTLEMLSFDVDGTRYELVFQGEGNYDEEKVVSDVRAIVEAQTDIMGVVPFDRYVFLYHLLPYRFGHGVEHKNSTSIVMGPADFDDPGFYSGFLSITAHEFFHAWNVERIRPEALYHPDYSTEAYTSTLWIYEGVTSYYTLVSMARAGLLTPDQFLGRLAGTIQGFEQTPGRDVTSVAMTSWDSWTKSGDAPPNTFYSFYTAGNVLGFLLDLEVRGRTNKEKSLDDVFRYLWDTYAAQDRGVPEDGFERALETVTGTSFDAFFESHIYGTEPIVYNDHLRHAGLVLKKEEDPNRPAVRLGLSHRAGDGGTVVIRNVDVSGPAFEAGLSENDVVVAIDGRRLTADNLVDLLRAYEPGETATLTYFHGEDLRTTAVTFEGGGNERYVIEHAGEEPSPVFEDIVGG